jgi:hypothetical protein
VVVVELVVVEVVVTWAVAACATASRAAPRRSRGIAEEAMVVIPFVRRDS